MVMIDLRTRLALEFVLNNLVDNNRYFSVIEEESIWLLPKVTSKNVHTYHILFDSYEERKESVELLEKKGFTALKGEVNPRD